MAGALLSVHAFVDLMDVRQWECENMCVSR